MFATTSVNLCPHTLLALMEYLRDCGATTDPAEAVDTAVRHWLAAMKQGESTPDAPRGYQWKSLFLPDGTWVRMAYRGDHEYAHVEGDRLMYKGRPTTPNKFASDHTNTVRNAWHDISIRLPGEKNWKMAYQRRKEQELAARRTTTLAHAAAPTGITIPAHAATPTPTPSAPVPAPSELVPASAATSSAPVPASTFAQPPAPQLPSPAESKSTATPREGGSVIPKPPTMQRNVEALPGWTEPERRKYRFRLEDVAFD